MFSGLTIWYWITNWVCSSLGKTILPTPRNSQLPVVIWVKVSRAFLQYALACQLVSSLFSSCLGSHVDTLCNFWHYWETQSHSKPILWLLQTFCPLSKMFSLVQNESLVQGCFVDASTGTGLHSSAFWLAVVYCSCSGLHLLQRDISLMRGEDYTHLWV